MKSSRNVILLVLAVMAICCRISFADFPDIDTEAEDTIAVILDTPSDCYTKKEIDAMLGHIMNSIPKAPNRYSNDEIDARIAAVKGTIPDVSGNYTNEQIDGKIASVKNSIPAIPKSPDVYSKAEINARTRALNDAIANLEIALLNVRNSIPAEIKWPVKTKKILTDIRNGIPSNSAGTTE